MEKIKILTREEFDKVVLPLKLPSFYDGDYVYNLYLLANETLKQLPSLGGQFSSFDVNPYELTYYVLGEYIYGAANKDKETLEAFKHDDKITASIASVSADKYLSLSMFNHKERKIANRFIPPISSLNLYVNFIQNVLARVEKTDIRLSLIRDLLFKSIGLCRCILILLIEGYETEAFGTWRTLHECECTLILLEKYGDPLINKYLKHLNFGLAFRNAISDKAQQDKVFYEMKDEMRELNLKSKDIKKYIEYGWLYGIEEFKNDPFSKLNFRDGLEKVAGLDNYSKVYEISSEIIHSTPLLIYSDKQYFYYQTLLVVYESFFRLEKIFASLFRERVTEEQLKQYEIFKAVYYSQLINIHERELKTFKEMTKKPRH